MEERIPRVQANLADIIFQMCVNFLMYTLLILVFYMLVRFYLEEDTTESNEDAGYSAVSVDDEELEDELNDNSAAPNSALSSPKASKKGGKKAQEIEMRSRLESTESLDERATGDVVGDLLEQGAGKNNKNKNEKEVNGMAPQSPPRLKKSNSFLNLNEWGEPEGTKEEVYQRVIFCAIGLNITFCIWGLVQERILTIPYGNDFFENSYGLVFMNRLGGFMVSAALVYYYNVKFVEMKLWEYSFPSVANMMSSWCQYEALKYVSFPTQMLAKAFKVVPVMLMGKFMYNKDYEAYEFGSAMVVGFGLYIFLDSSEKIDFKQNVFGDPESVTGAWCGIVLLCCFLAFDSFTGQWQARMFQLHKAMSPLQMMLVMNGFSSVFSFITLVHMEELEYSFNFVYDHPSIALHLLVFVICSIVGQLFIFYTVKNFGAVVFSIIMSIRILFSTLLSCFVYSHPITEMGVLGILIVFGAIAYRIRRKTAGRDIIRWKTKEKKVDPASTKKIYQEWQEHHDC